MGDLNVQELANTAWAFAMVGNRDALLFTALGRAAERRVEDFNTQGLALPPYLLECDEAAVAKDERLLHEMTLGSRSTERRTRDRCGVCYEDRCSRRRVLFVRSV